MSVTTTENQRFIKSFAAEKKQRLIPAAFRKRKIYKFFKRLFDLVISSVIIIFVLSWLLPLLMILIRIDSPGPVFFIQRRVGFLGKSFSCLKLRTMVVNTVCDHQQAICNDPRITRVGKFLRITSLDELPQFFNVLLGEMSIVGPRPHMHKDNEDFAKVVANYQFRLYVKPGITGIAQLKGCRGPAKNFHSIFHRYQWDAFYIRNANLSLDFKIVRLTAFQMMQSIFSFRRSSEKKKQKDIRSESPAWVI